MSLKVRGRLDTLNQYMDDLVPQGVWLAGALLCVMAMLGEAIPLVCGGEFASSVLPFQVLAVGMTFQVLAMFCHGVANAFDRPRYVAVVGVTICVVNVLGDWLLVPWRGPLGAALATSAAMAIGNLLYLPLLNRVEPLRSARRRRRWLTVLGAAPCALTVVWCGMVPNVAMRLALSAVTVLLWLGVARWAGVFQRRACVAAEQIAMPRSVLGLVRLWYRLFGSGAA